MSAETAVSQGRDEHYIRVLRRNFRTWRGQRPFWAGLLTLLGGIPIAYFPYATFKIGHMNLAMQTTAGAGSLIIGVLLVTLGLTMWFQHIVRVFAGVATILLALVSLPIANLGGFIIGFVLSLTGGALSLSWAPGRPVSADEAPAVQQAAPASPAVPEQRDGFDTDTHETSIEGNGGRNSAG
ncbi:DUF6114 domain-containing protein [Streptomyces pristinaespiralis]|jgi:hypothetical protein|uniref:Integral membrane protein n=2 Tax=Streptomyces pristinaespiralis TaxID=38300 RepID=B5H9F4_STRE2|nr:DUF6114 domain-containing protein [Streptomyces pristinaespiralis]ALC20779.1 membrane protein [Streptomyces pristinaespiralis]EDY63465.2 integral membrane protein [Streptomyces pristinaespiralis ATCC 25486]QMU16412.1 hypothetical protein H3L99_24640 [Streptomyces pristinaespiralis]